MAGSQDVKKKEIKQTEKPKVTLNTIKLDFFCYNCIVSFIMAIFLITSFILLTSSVDITEVTGIVGADSNIYNKIINFLLNFKALPLVVILIPLIAGSVEAYIGKTSENLRDAAVVDVTFITFLSILAMYPQVAQKEMIYTLPRVLGYGLSFNVDMLSFIMAATAGVLWFFVSIYAHDYMGIEKHRNRFYLWMSVTFAGILGTVMAGDLFTMFLFFEIMTFSSYLLVAHNQSL